MKFGGTNNSDLLCLQEVNISDLELRVDWLGSKDIMYFSVRQSMYPFLTGLKAAGSFSRTSRKYWYCGHCYLLKEVCQECGAVRLGGGLQACLVLAVSISENFR